MLAAGCGDDPVQLDEITIKILQDEVVLRWFGAEAELRANGRWPSGSHLVWISSDESVATVAPDPIVNDDSVARVTAAGRGQVVTVALQGRASGTAVR